MPIPPKHPRLRTAVRKTAKWGGALVTVVLVALWISSAFFMVSRHGGSADELTVWRGTIVWLSSPPDPSPIPYETVWMWLDPPEMASSFMWRHRPGWWVIAIPLWLPALITLFPTVFAWRADAVRRRRARAGHCPVCDYDRSGLAAGVVCPECGAAAGAR